MRYLVAYDCSPTARLALDRTLELLQPQRGDFLVVLMIAEELPELLLTEQTIHRVTAARLHDAQIVMDALGQKLDELNVPHETIAKHSDSPAEDILQATETHQADLLVVGSGMIREGALKGLLLGSVAQRCVNESTVPVLVVHKRCQETSSSSSSAAV